MKNARISLTPSSCEDLKVLQGMRRWNKSFPFFSIMCHCRDSRVSSDLDQKSQNKTK